MPASAGVVFCDLQPQAAADAEAWRLGAERHETPHRIGAVGLHEVVPEADPQVRVVLQERAQQIRFIPRHPQLEPLPRVFERVGHIVEVHQHAGFEARQELEQDVIDVAAGLGDVEESTNNMSESDS